MIDMIIDEIYKSLDNDCYLVALMSALLLPDICGAIEYPHDRNGSRYKKWYSVYIGKYETDGENDDMQYPSANLIYDLRCSLVHNGNPFINLDHQNLNQFELLITNDDMFGGCASICKETGERTLKIGIKNLCFKLCSLAKYYYDCNREKFQFNYSVIDIRNYNI